MPLLSSPKLAITSPSIVLAPLMMTSPLAPLPAFVAVDLDIQHGIIRQPGTVAVG